MKLLFKLLLAAAAALAAANAGTLAQFRTVLGDIDVELFDRDKPVTVQNFIRYVTNGYYQNVFFHRCVSDFVVQGGGYFTANPQSSDPFTNAYYVPTFPPITNEFGVGPRLSNVYGTVAMAKTSDPNSATSQFFFNLADNSASLDNTNNSGGFTVFGRVVRGTNVLNHFKTSSYGLGIVNMSLWYPGTQFGAVFSELPVNYVGISHPHYNNLFYVDISLLRVEVRLLPDKSREISWNSVLNQPNYVEFTTIFPPVWQVLAATNGTGNVITVTDAATNAPTRFYRVRVAY
jgi:cyclophilin family peptidyl-prolyl cis-trans isomerase